MDPLRTGFRSPRARVTLAFVTLTATTRLTATPKTGLERLSAIAGGVELKAEKASDGKPSRRTFRMTAYTGASFARCWTIKGKAKLVQLVIALDGMEPISGRGLPMLVDHGAFHGSAGVGPAGVARSSKVEEGEGYVLEGDLVETEEGRHVASLADQGFPWTASVGVRCLEEKELAEGDELEVNGLKLKGPDVYVWTKSALYETSFITAGPADAATSAEVLHDMGDEIKQLTTTPAVPIDRAQLEAEFTKGLQAKKNAFVDALVAAGAKKRWARDQFDDGATIEQAHAAYAQLMRAERDEAVGKVEHLVKTGKLSEQDGIRAKTGIGRGFEPEAPGKKAKAKSKVLDRLELERSSKGTGKVARMTRADRRILAELAGSYREWAQASDEGLLLRTVYPRHQGGAELLRVAQLAEEAGIIRERASQKGIPFAPPYSVNPATIEALAERLRQFSEHFGGDGLTEQLASTWSKDAHTYSQMVVKGYLAALFKPLEDDVGAGWAQRVAMTVSSNQPEEDYRTLGPPPQIREWIGMRQTKFMPFNELKIPNHTYEGTLDFSLNDFRFDKSGQISLRMSELGVRGRQHWDVLATSVLLNNPTCLDGNALFATNHTWGGGFTNKNTVTSSDIPQLSVSNPANPTPQEMGAAIMGVVQYFFQMQDQTGSPLNGGGRQFCVVVPPNLWGPAVTAVRAARLNFGQDNPLLEQDYSVDVIPNGWLVTSFVGASTNTNTFYVFRTDSAARAIVLQDVTGWEAQMLGPGSELTTMQDRVLFGLRAVRGSGAAYWEHVIQAQLS